MFLIRLKTLGNCIIPDLDNFIVYDGNHDIMDLEQYFTKDQIARSNKAPRGDLYQLLSTHVVEHISPNSIDYKTQVRGKTREKAKIELEKRNGLDQTNKPPIDTTIRALRVLRIPDCKEKLENEYFDNLSILDRIVNDDSFAVTIKKVAKKLLNENLNSKLDKKFVVI